MYRPVRYLDSALHRVGIAALIGLLLLALVVGVLARSWRTALITVAAVVTSLTAALWVLHLRGGTLTSMTLIGLAAVAVLVVDDAVGDVAGLRPLLRQRPDDGRPSAALVAEAVRARRGPLTVATLVTLLALGPLFLLPGPVGAMVRPAVLTFALALGASLLVGARRHAGARPRPVPGHGLGGDRGPVLVPRLVRPVRRLGTPRSRPAGGPVGPPGGRRRRSGGPRPARPPRVRCCCSPATTLPSAQDRSVVVHLQAAPGTALAEMNRITTAAAAELSGLSGVRSVGTHVGRAVASDRVSDVDTSEIWLTVADGADYTATLTSVRSTMRGYPGLRSDVSTYADDQLAAAGATTGDTLIVRVYGQDLATLRSTAEDVRQEIQTVPGVIAPTVEAQVTEPTIEIQVDLQAARAVRPAAG